MSAPPATSSTGSTPRLAAVRVNSANGLVPSLSLDAGFMNTQLSPTGKSPRPPDEVIANLTKVARSENAGDAASSSRDPSRHQSIDESSHAAAIAAAMLATGDDSDDECH